MPGDGMEASTVLRSFSSEEGMIVDVFSSIT